MIVAAYGLILPKIILDVPAKGCLNLHASLLPRWRGAAPIERAIMAGNTETGVVAMRMEEGLDTGPVALAERIVIGPDANAGEIRDRLAHIGAGLMTRALASLEGLAFPRRRKPASPTLIKSTRRKRGSIGENRHRTSTIWCAASRRFPVLFSRRISARELRVSKFYARGSPKETGRPAAYSTMA